MTEKEVGVACDRLAESLGWTVERYEQSRATRIAEGLPDRRYVHLARGMRVWVELKRPGGKLTAAQRVWLGVELQAGGLATTVESADQLAKLFAVLARRSAVLEAEARRLCEQWVDLTWQRGPRDGADAATARGLTAPPRRRRRRAG